MKELNLANTTYYRMQPMKGMKKFFLDIDFLKED